MKRGNFTEFKQSSRLLILYETEEIYLSLCLDMLVVQTRNNYENELMVIFGAGLLLRSECKVVGGLLMDSGAVYESSSRLYIENSMNNNCDVTQTRFPILSVFFYLAYRRLLPR